MIPSQKTRYDTFGGIFMPESLMAAISELSDFFEKCKQDHEFNKQFRALLKNYAGRPTAFTEVAQFAQHCNGPRLFLKREDLLHTGAHKINNALGQCLLAKKMRKNRIIAETGAGQHGVATATACAYLNLSCEIYMGEVDAARQLPNVEKMRLLGAKVITVSTGARTLKDAVNAALRDYAASFESTHYCLGSALGPYPYPEMVHFFQSVIGEETLLQSKAAFGHLPDRIIACVGGGSNAIGIFSPFLSNPAIALIGVEAGGESLQAGKHAARFQGGRPGVLHGCYSYVLQDDNGQILPTHSISAGLDYPMVGPEHAKYHENGRIFYSSVTDQEALTAFKALIKTEGIIPALESSHALAFYQREAHQWPKNETVIINLSGRGDKDLPYLQAAGKL